MSRGVAARASAGLLLGLLLVGMVPVARAKDTKIMPGAPPTVLWGRVAAVMPSRGQLVLSYEDGTSAELVSAPRLLRGIHVGQTVQAVLDGSVVRFVEPVGAPFAIARSVDAARIAG